MIPDQRKKPTFLQDARHLLLSDGAIRWPRRSGTRDLKQVSADHKKLVDAIIAGVPAEQVKDRMVDLDTRRKDLERQLSASPATDSVRIHPSMATSYRGRISQLIAGLSDAEWMDEAKAALRALIERVELVPVSAEARETGRPGLAINLHSALASLLRLACGLPMHEVVETAGQTQKAPQKAGHYGSNNAHQGYEQIQNIDSIYELALVAGTHNRRNLPELRCAV